VHRADCTNAVALSASKGDRVIEVEWDRERPGAFVASIEIEALDRSRLLRDVTTVLSEQHVDILASSTHTGTDRIALLRFDFELADPSHLESLLSTLKRVDSVYDAYRVLPGRARG
jgi:GTP pyrophosphokinase